MLACLSKARSCSDMKRLLEESQRYVPSYAEHGLFLQVRQPAGDVKRLYGTVLFAPHPAAIFAEYFLYSSASSGCRSSAFSFASTALRQESRARTVSPAAW